MTLREPPEAPKASIVIRTYNEAQHLPEALQCVSHQKFESYEVVIVDSGSTDKTVEIAELAGARIVHIPKEDFTFGRSLNVGCGGSRGQILVFISGHCYPVGENWLGAMVAPFDDKMIGLVYGKQRGGETTKYSEHRHFEKTFCDESAQPQEGFFCNNANSAILKSLWERRPFDESLTGLEDLDWAKWLLAQGLRVAYTADGTVKHVHEEKWAQVFRRYEREAIALKRILPDISFSFFDFTRLICQSSVLDMKHASANRVLWEKWKEIVAFRAMQYWGTYRGSSNHKTVTQQMKEKFYYPK